MPTLDIADFRHGLDLRKSALSAVGGSLQVLDNAVLTNGGEIAKRMAFVSVGSLPPGAFGLFGQGGGLRCFGTGPAPDASLLPLDTVYHELALWDVVTPAEAAMVSVQEVQVYRNKFWVVGSIARGDTLNWYDGQVTINLPGDSGRVFRSKMYRTSESLLRFSTIDYPQYDTDESDYPGGGFIDLSANDPDSEDVHGLEIFYDQLAVFARRTVQIWSVDPDPSLNALKQVLRIGAVASHSIRQFGTGDVLFLSDSGIRSLRAINQTLAAGVIDVGSPIDALAQAQVVSNFEAAAAAQAVVEPVTGRYWLAVGGTIYVLSFFPSAKISAWSTFTVPFTVRSFAVLGNRVFVLDTNNNVYLYGGPDGMTYDDCLVRVRTPHLSADKPTQLKKVQALSVVASGQWALNLSCLSDNTELYEPVAQVSGATQEWHRIPAAGRGTHIGLELVSQAPGPATISSAAIDFLDNEKL